mmetsp:Transcript_24429/g.96934  ORF Transcript_24429/g.96934 Transcript_24429/m.96934 type:complete len:2723 (+) Transcript_24429:2309-10477(+)
MGALQMILGGAPAGPAGTGKTETTKDLAKALAKQCVVFNCSDGLDYCAMGKFFKGLASCGAWACFDEFNRINIEVLSVIGQQIMSIQLALKNRVEVMEFEGSSIQVRSGFGVFITMNPGYAGRTELPDSLSALFRPVAMMVPDYALIGEIMFFAYGFSDAKSLGRKMVTTFKLCSEQCSSQSHYDYGMRAVKTVITAAGNLKRTEPESDEMVLLLRALQDVNVPKFLPGDLPLFQGIISDLFPGKRKPDVSYGALYMVMKFVIRRKSLQPHRWFISKVIQLYEMIVVRHGLMLVGPTGGGKSANLCVLEDTLGELKTRGESGFAFERCIVYQLNPKSITMGQMYGQFDENTREWQDGIMSTMYRQSAASTTSDRKWIMFNGPVDAIWVENMNTVLDDNKKLCLVSGESIKMSNEMTMMFEVEDLMVASPATVSRVGIIFQEPKALGLQPLVETWLTTMLAKVPQFKETDLKQKLIFLFDMYAYSAIAFVRRSSSELVQTVDNNLVQSLTRLLSCYFESFYQLQGSDLPKPDEVTPVVEHVEALFAFALVWSVGCTGREKDHESFNVFLRGQLKVHAAKLPYPEDGSVYDYFWGLQAGRWVKWMTTIDPYQIDTKLAFAELIVPTADSICSTFLLGKLINMRSHVLIVGETGTGKTVTISQYMCGEAIVMGKKIPDNVLPMTMAFSAQTSANQTQDTLDTKLEKRRRGVFGPPAGKVALLHVDDLNMPKRETYGAQPPVELLRQWFDQGGWYDRTGSLGFRKIVDLILVGSMGPPGGGRQQVTARFVRHFNVIGLLELSDASKAHIFITILDSFLSHFSDAVSVKCQAIVHATIDIFNKIIAKLLPTPSKPHYTFNLRDLAKVFQGVLMGSPKHIVDALAIARLWFHELQRVFEDRLTALEDHTWFRATAMTRVETCFRDSGVSKGEDHIVPMDRPLVFCDFLDQAADPKIYCEVTSVDTLKQVVHEFLSDHNVESKAPMRLVMFLDAIEHVTRIARILRQPQGNALLLGIGGSGRQSMSKLATYIIGYDLFQVEISKGYGRNEWREDLRRCLLKAGVKRKPTTFVFSDTQIVFELMLEDVNNILNSGDVPNLYLPEDHEAIIAACRVECQKKHLAPTKLNIFAQYVLSVRGNLHICLCMSPLGDHFRERLRQFPSIVNCSTIDWFTAWPAEALESVGASSIAGVDENDKHSVIVNEIDRRPVVQMFKFVHQSVEEKSAEFWEVLRRHNHVTPTSYLELLKTYKSVLQTKRDEVGTLKARLQVGLDKLINTATQVAALQVQLRDMEPQLIKTQGEVEKMIVKIDVDKQDASETQKLVVAEEASAREKELETQSIADDAQRDLDEALPALDEATKCLNSLKKADIDEVRTMGKPPAGVKLTMEACCIMFNVKPEIEKDAANPGKKVNNYFKAAQKEILSLGPKLIEKMKGYDKDNIPLKTVHAISPYIAMDEFQPGVIEKASRACTAMCMWVRAMHKYHEVSVVVEPKKKLLAEAQESLAATQATLAEAQAKLGSVMDKIHTLETEFNAAYQKKEQLVRDVEECRARLVRAQKLIGGLGGERTRWSDACARLEKAHTNLLGDSVISAATIAYAGPFTPDFRRDLTSIWQSHLCQLGLPHTYGCDIRQTLSDPATIRLWTIRGLPQDSHSIENGIIMSMARRFPLLIDPQGQANSFVKNMGKDASVAENGLEVTRLTDKNFLRTVENAVRFGRWVLLESIGETLEAALEPLLLQQTYVQGGTTMIRLGDSTIPWNDAFRFYMTTTLTNPSYAPDVQVKVSLLNFAITPVGLEDQLLGVTIVQERPDMQEKKNTLVLANAKMKRELQELENKILHLLSNSTGNILDDHELIETLASSKVTSEEIGSKVAEAELTEREIDASRELYRPVACRATKLYFAVSNLAVVSPMYQYSLQWFTRLFVAAVHLADKADILEIRLENLSSYLTYYLYVNICRSLFEKTKLLFSFLLTIKVLGNDVDSGAWHFLISGTTRMSIPHTVLRNPAPDWIDTRMWREIQTLAALPAFTSIDKSLCTDTRGWKAFYDATDPQSFTLPDPWGTRLNQFEKLCVLRCLRADKIPDGVMDFVIDTLGQRFVEPPPFNLAECFRDSSATTPLLFVLTKGSDPTKAFAEFCESVKFDKKIKKLSLGQGQGSKASRMIEEATQKGSWVYLQNCHLFVSWLVILEGLCDGLFTETTHKEFRLWLTSMPTPQFPVSILHSAVKMTMEPPKGLKANLRSVFCKLDDTKLNVTSHPATHCKLFFALVLFHASVQERRKFGPLGWNVPYEFNETDLDISRGQLAMFLDSCDNVPYRILQFLTSYINYGGRVTDYIDLRTIDVIIKSFYRAEVLQTGFAFDPHGTYLSIDPDPTAPHACYMQYIETLPLTAGPGIFGMHDNANITCAFNETFTIFDTLVALESSGGSRASSQTAGNSREDIIACEAKDICARLDKCGHFDINNVTMLYPVTYEESMNTVLVQECIRYDKLVSVMLQTLPELLKALQGLVVMSNELEAMGKSIATATVPVIWEEKAYPSLKKLGSWTDDLLRRIRFIWSWIDHGIPITFWISGLYFPQAFLTGSLQNFARRRSAPIDTIAFDFIMLGTSDPQSILQKPADGVYVYGLFLEGARWDPKLGSLADSRPQQLYTSVPLLHLLPVKDRESPSRGIYRCPVYKILSRCGTLSTTGHSTNFVMWIEIPSDRVNDKNNDGLPDQPCWVKAGVAAFCALQF